jgi:hypothetical protein
MQFRVLARLSDLIRIPFRRDVARLPGQTCPACDGRLTVRPDRLDCPCCGWWETDPGVRQ